MDNRIGICGAHRTGKTTLGRILAECLGFEFVETYVSSAEVWKNSGYSPSDYLPFSVRIKVQFELIKHMDMVFSSKMNYNYVTDRTFVDLIGYLLANIDPTCSRLFDSDVNEFIDTCIERQNKHFMKTIMVRPGIQCDTEPGKAGITYLSQGYVQAVDRIVLGTVVGNLPAKDVIIIPPDITKNSERIEYITNSRAFNDEFS